ncbi:hypothetical protein DAERI_020387 [Deinococcus aerius]|uniref:Uncharacterized protein n=1 Tax=Deinococcus aerius TaxID=200253 RepID=A0A2I9D3J5_9DEIO|nr:hypothetical protein [Deinococcus aerius]GBF04790.1 hypothetical protein DAERI_020387 [Deinococcus aerius]
MPASSTPEPTTFVIPALPTWRRSGGRADPSASRLHKLVGYYTQGARPNHTRMREYHTWKDHVRAHAPPGLLGVRPTDERSRVRLDVVCFFANKTHADPENVRKGVVDALFPQGDKWVYGSHDHPRYDPARPRVEVTVTLFQTVLPGGSGQRPRTAKAGKTAEPRAMETGPQAQRPVRTSSTGKEPGQRTRKAQGDEPSRKTAGRKAAPAPIGLGWWEGLSAWVAGWGVKMGTRARRPSRRPSRRRSR